MEDIKNIQSLGYNRLKRSTKILLTAIICIATIFLITQTAIAKALTSGWRTVTAEPVSLEAADNYFKTKNQTSGENSSDTTPPSTDAVSPPQIDGDQSTDSQLYPTEIVELAKNLEHDPLAIFNYVHNHIDYAPYYGLRKGALLTLLDESGNDFDQASLLIALLKASGHSARFAKGSMAMSVEALADWLGLEKNGDLVDSLLSRAGIPFSKLRGIYKVSRVWVLFSKYQLDPAYKKYENYSPVDIVSMLGYDRSAFLESVKSGATITNDYTQNLNEANLRAKLSEYTSNLAKALRARHAGKDLSKIIGGRKIEQKTLTKLSKGIVFSASANEQWDEVPDALIDTFHVQFHGIDHKFKVPDIGAMRLTISFSQNDLRPELRLNGSLVSSGNPTTEGSFFRLTLTADHPFAAFDGTYADQTVETSLYSGSKFIYAIVLNYGISSNSLLRYARKRLDTSKRNGFSSTSEPVLGETLNMMGLNYAKQVMMIDNISQQIHKTLNGIHHYFGLVEQTQSIVINWLGIRKFYASKKINYSSNHMTAQSISAWAVGSSLEHGIMEQMLGVTAASSVKVLQLANESGQKIYHAKPGNISSIEETIRPTYGESTVDLMKTFVNNEGWIILPENGRIQINEWSGKAWVGYGPDTDKTAYGAINGYRIGGGFHGGYSSKKEHVANSTTFPEETKSEHLNKILYQTTKTEELEIDQSAAQGAGGGMCQ